MKLKLFKYGITNLIVSCGEPSDLSDLPSELGRKFIKSDLALRPSESRKVMVYFTLARELNTRNLRYFDFGAATVHESDKKGERPYHRPDITYSLRNYARTTQRLPDDDAHIDIVNHLLVCHDPDEQNMGYAQLFISSKLKSMFPFYGQPKGHTEHMDESSLAYLDELAKWLR